jgi:hypothetical protein
VDASKCQSPSIIRSRSTGCTSPYSAFAARNCSAVGRQWAFAAELACCKMRGRQLHAAGLSLANNAQSRSLRSCHASVAPLNLRKTIDGGQRVYRIFESAPAVFLVLDEEGRTVDEFKIVECGGGARGISVKKAFRYKRRRLGTPDLASGFAAELSAARTRH